MVRLKVKVGSISMVVDLMVQAKAIDICTAQARKAQAVAMAAVTADDRGE